MTLGELAAFLGGTPGGAAETQVTGLGTPDAAEPGELVVAFDAGALAVAEESLAAAVVVPRGLVCTKPSIAVDQPRIALVQLLHAFEPPVPPPAGIHPTAVVDPTATVGDEPSLGPHVVVEAGAVIGRRARIGANSVIGAGARVGDEVLFHANVTVYPNSSIGSRVILHSGAVIGADGYGYRQEQRRHIKIPQLGTVILEDDVEVGANSTIDRATVGRTTIGAGTKIDNQVQIGHNCRIGHDCLIIAQVGIAGSCEIGNQVTIAGQVGISDHLKIGDRAVLAAGSGVMRDVPAGDVIAGIPGQPQQQWFRMFAGLRRLPALNRRVRRIEALLHLDDEESAGRDA